MTENKCYDCRHRGEVPGSAHSQCLHPVTGDVRSNPIAGLIGIMGRRSGATVVDTQGAADRLEIRANYHGIRNGWFIWPMNFDPTWLENCNGFEQRSEQAQSADAVDPGAAS